MPELPEVETIRRDLAARIVGRSIAEVEVPDPAIFTGYKRGSKAPKDISLNGFVRDLKGKTILHVLRFGKYLIFEFKQEGALILHLRMTGQLLVDPEQFKARLRLVLTGAPNLVLVFQDQRRFGEVAYAQNWRLFEPLAKLGPEPLNGGLSPEHLRSKLKFRSASIHSLLLNQRIIAGLGNIYANEALFHSGIRPERCGNSISGKEASALCANIQKVLDQSIASRGYSMSNYVDTFGKRGAMQNHSWVYDWEGDPCRKCKTLIVRRILCGRSVYFCRKCQR